MTNHSRNQAIRAIDRVLKEIPAASHRNRDGAPFAQRFDRLTVDLQEARASLAAGQPVPKLAGLVRWVADWIADVDDPIIPLIGAVEAAAAPFGSKAT